MEIGNLQPRKVSGCWRINNEGDHIPISDPICNRSLYLKGQALMFVPPGYDFASDPPYIAVVKSDDDHSVVGMIAWGDGMVVEFAEE